MLLPLRFLLQSLLQLLQVELPLLGLLLQRFLVLLVLLLHLLLRPLRLQ